MTTTLTRLYDDYTTANKVMEELESVGVPASEISIVASNADSWYSATKSHDRDHDGVDDRAEGAATGAVIGAATGGVAGLLAGLGLLAIPGIGPVVAAGWFASTAVVAAAGGVTGGIIGALAEAGVSDEDAHVYAEGVRRGGTLLTVRIPEADRVRVETIMDRGAVNIWDRGLAYRKAGWKTFDPAASPYSADQVRREREQYRKNAA